MLAAYNDAQQGQRTAYLHRPHDTIAQEADRSALFLLCCQCLTLLATCCVSQQNIAILSKGQMTLLLQGGRGSTCQLFPAEVPLFTRVSCMLHLQSIGRHYLVCKERITCLLLCLQGSGLPLC